MSGRTVGSPEGKMLDRRPLGSAPIEPHPVRERYGSTMRLLVAVAVVLAVGVAVLGGVRSFEAVSNRFGSPLVPLTADGMIVACTALRLAALTRGWRLPGSLVTTYVFIVGTIWLNVAAAHGWADALAHGLAPAAYAVLVEMLAQMLRLQLRLSKPRAARVSALTWATSPVITTRVWLHLARTGREDPGAARALVQQVVRMRSRLRSVCPNGWHPFDGARSARTAALHTIRDGLLSAADVAALLPESDRLTPSELLARIDRAALDTPTGPGAPVVHPRELDGRTAEETGWGVPVHPNRETPVHPQTGAPPPTPVHRTEANRGPGQPDRPTDRDGISTGRDDRTDEDLVVVLRAHSAEHNDGQPLSQREVRKVLGVGTPKAKRLVEAAGWAPNAASNREKSERDATESPEADEPNQIDIYELEMSDAR